MTVLRRFRLVVVTAILGAVLAGSPASAQDPGESNATAATTPEGAPIAPVDAAGEVHSWALAPAGSLDPDGAGNRPNLSYDLDPGARVEDAVTVYNFGTAQLTFRVYGTDAVNNADGSFDLIPGDQEPGDAGSWITVSQGNITVDPGTQVTIPITITVPAGATPGDHAGAILASNAVPGVGPDGQTVSLDRRTGTRVYIRVAGPVEPNLAIENVEASYSPSLNPLGGTATVRYRIVNRGNVRLSGAHTVSVTGPFGTMRQRVPDKDLEELLPGEDVELDASFDGVPALGLILAEVSLEQFGDGMEATVKTRTGIALAPPLTVILLLVALALVLRSRRAYRGHTRRPGPSGTRPQEPEVREPQLT